MKQIIINTLRKNYPVLIGSSIFESVINLINNNNNLYKNILVVIDKNVFNFHHDYIINTFGAKTNKIYFLKINAGEKTKSFNGLSVILSELIKKKYGRDTLLIAIGGGVTGDLAGFAASIYMRGIQLIHIPTTILSSVDSAVGGKTAVNYNSYKNLIGTFYQPELVLIDTDFIQSLPEVEINSGVGELIKYAYLTNKDFYNYLKKNIDLIYSLDKQALNKVIYESVLFKASVVEKDETENNLRKVLNFGHTFAHAFESLSNLKLKHGEAVAAGIISALFLSNKKGLLPEKKLTDFLELPLKVKLPSGFIKDYKHLINFMYGDKKNREGRMNFILLADIGEIITDINASEDDIFYSLDMAANLLGNE